MAEKKVKKKAKKKATKKKVKKATRKDMKHAAISRAVERILLETEKVKIFGNIIKLSLDKNPNTEFLESLTAGTRSVTQELVRAVDDLAAAATN